MPARAVVSEPPPFCPTTDVVCKGLTSLQSRLQRGQQQKESKSLPQEASQQGNPVPCCNKATESGEDRSPAT
eukprot:12414591-Karenia_brevis.AAC.1